MAGRASSSRKADGLSGVSRRRACHCPGDLKTQSFVGTIAKTKKGAEQKAAFEAIKKLDIFTESMRYQWMKENKSFGFDVTDGRLGFLRNRMKTAKLEVLQYVNNELDRIEEFEKEIYNFENIDPEEDLCCNTWSFIASVNNI